MPKIDFTGVALVVSALGTLVTAFGIAIVGIMTARQRKVIDEQTKVIAQVEKQGNSVALEQKRVTAAALRTAAAVTKAPEDELKARDAETLYFEAKKQAESNAR